MICLYKLDIHLNVEYAVQATEQRNGPCNLAHYCMCWFICVLYIVHHHIMNVSWVTYEYVHKMAKNGDLSSQTIGSKNISTCKA